MYQDLFLLQNICRFISVLQALEPDPYWNPLGTFVEPLLLLLKFRQLVGSDKVVNIKLDFIAHLHRCIFHADVVFLETIKCHINQKTEKESLECVCKSKNSEFS